MKRHPFFLIFLVLYFLLSPFKVKAQSLIIDQTLGTESSIITPIDLLNERIDGGAIRGVNLFHSFLEFNVGEGRGVYFSNPAIVENILTRVTGNNPSDILGRLGVLGEANLFLLNPNGIYFGENASLDIRGSFVATTSDGIRLGEEGIFSAIDTTNSQLLSVQPGALFSNALRQHQALINNEGNLTVGNGQNLILLADAIISTGQLVAPQGRLRVEGINGDVKVGNLIAEIANLSASENLLLEESQLRTTGDLTLLAKEIVRIRDSSTNPFLALAGGNLVVKGIQGIDIQTLNHSQIPFQSQGDMVFISDGKISVDAHFTSGGNFSILNLLGEPVEFTSIYDPIIQTAGDFISGGYGPGAALKVEAEGDILFNGDIVINSPDLAFQGAPPDTDEFLLGNFPALILRADGDIRVGNINTSSPGGGGPIILEAGNQIEIVNGTVSSNSPGGFAGLIDIQADDSISITDSSLSANSFGFSGAVTGGEINLQAGSIEIINSTINANSDGFENLGEGGEITLNAETGSISLIGTDLSTNSMGFGFAGNISLTANDQVIGEGSSLRSNARDGIAGFIEVTANNSVSFTDSDLTAESNIFNEREGGAIEINADTGSISLNNVNLSATSRGNGSSGELALLAGDQINIEDSLIQSNADAGFAGSIETIAGNSVFVINSQFTAQSNSTDSTREGGAIAITSDTGSISLNDSDFNASSLGAGLAGSISLTANDQIIGEVSSLRSNAGNGIAGFIEVTANNSVSFTDSELTAESNVFNDREGGAIDINAQTDSISLDNVVLSTTALGVGLSGDIELLAGNQINVANSTIESNATSGFAGSIEAIAGNSVSIIDSQLTAESDGFNSFGEGGAINITAQKGFISLVGSNSINAPNPLSNISTTAFGEGFAGNIQLLAASDIIANNTLIQNNAIQGLAGSIEVQASNSISLNNSRVSAQSFGLDNVEDDDLSADIFIRGSSIDLNNSQINAGTSGSFNAGSITVESTNQGTVNINASRIETDALDGATGNGGSIEITGNLVDIQNDSTISSSSSGLDSNAGEIVVTSQTLQLTGGSTLNASTRGEGDAGEVRILNANLVIVDGESSDGQQTIIESAVQPNAIGNAGGVEINTNQLRITNGGNINASTRGEGDAGEVQILNANLVIIDGESSDGRASTIESSVQPNAIGNAGGVEINTNELRVTNGGEINASTLGEGDAGEVQILNANLVIIDGESSDVRASTIESSVQPNAIGNAGGVEINTNELRVTNGGEINASTLGEGDAGEVQILNANLVIIDGESSNGQASTIESAVSTNAIGNAVGIEIDTNDLQVTNGGDINASTFGQGDAGEIEITNPNLVVVDGTRNDGTPSRIQSVIGNQAIGNSRGININTQTLRITNRGIITTSTFGEGNAGNLELTAKSEIFLNGGQINSAIQTTGISTEVSNINLQTNQLSLENNSQISAATSGDGDGGEIFIQANDFITLDSSLITAAVNQGASGEEGVLGGEINIITDTLTLTNGSQILASTVGQGEANSITVTANTFETSSGSQLSTQTSSNFNAGDITLRVTDTILLSGNNSGLFATTTSQSSGNGGDILVDPEIVTISDGAGIAANSEGSGQGGEINLQAGSLTLDNQAFITAATTSNRGGEITLQIQDILLLRNNSNITATAGTSGAGGDGGNININAQFVVAVPNENSDITANAFAGNGGNIDIDSTSIFGLQFRSQQTPLSDITASSQFGLAGNVQIDTPEVDPTSGLVELPGAIVDAEGLIAKNVCTVEEGKIAGGSSFVLTGRGGFPPSPHDPLTHPSGLVEWANRAEEQPNSPVVLNPYSTNTDISVPRRKRVIEQAQGWIFTPDGQIILTAEASTIAPQTSSLTHPDCN